jgi:hypothetical protein
MPATSSLKSVCVPCPIIDDRAGFTGFSNGSSEREGGNDLHDFLEVPIVVE